MSLIAGGAAITKIPWSQIVTGGQALIELADILYKKFKGRKGNKISVEDRVALLERNEEEQAKLVKSLVERQNALVAEIGFLRRTLYIFIVFTLIYFVLFAWHIFNHSS